MREAHDGYRQRDRRVHGAYDADAGIGHDRPAAGRGVRRPHLPAGHGHDGFGRVQYAVHELRHNGRNKFEVHQGDHFEPPDAKQFRRQDGFPARRTERAILPAGLLDADFQRQWDLRRRDPHAAPCGRRRTAHDGERSRGPVVQQPGRHQGRHRTAGARRDPAARRHLPGRAGRHDRRGCGHGDGGSRSKRLTGRIGRRRGSLHNVA